MKLGHKYRYTFLICLLLLSSFCMPNSIILANEFVPPVADFSCEPSSGTTPLNVHFTNNCTGDIEYCEWDFGDGTAIISGCEDQDHIYDIPGTYIVTLTVIGLDGSDTVTCTIEVLPFGKIDSKDLQVRATPNPPVLLYPGSNYDPDNPDGYNIFTTTPTFQWNSVTSVDRYGLYISKYPYGSGNIVYENENITGTVFHLNDGVLVNGERYRWNMRAHNSEGWSSSYSNTRYFKVNPPLPITLKAPWTCSQTWQAGSPGSFYGDGYHTGNRYYAVDFNKVGGEDYGEPILAAAAGWATTHYADDAGKYVVIEHSDEFITTYSHLSTYSIPINKRCYVLQGQEIGRCGNSGDVDPPPTPENPKASSHLHFVLRKDNISMPPDPMNGYAMFDGAWITSSNCPIPTVIISSAVPLPSTLSPGDTLTITYYIQNNLSCDWDVMLGASIYSNSTGYKSDPVNDKKVSVPPSSSQHQRSFKVPTDSPAGSYDLVVALWLDRNGNNVIDSGSEDEPRLYGMTITNSITIELSSTTTTTSSTTTTKTTTTTTTLATTTTNTPATTTNPTTTVAQTTTTAVPTTTVVASTTTTVTPGTTISTTSTTTIQAPTTTTTSTTITTTTNPGTCNPKLHYGYDTSGNTHSVYVDSDNVAYLADEGKGLQIIDVTNPKVPELLYEYDTGGLLAYGVYVSDKIAYMAAHSSKPKKSVLKIIDVSDPKNPYERGEYTDEVGTAVGVHVVGDTAYLADKKSMKIINVSDTSDPKLLATWLSGANSHDDTNDVCVVGKTAYIADGIAGLTIVDCTDPNNLYQKGNHYTGTIAMGVCVLNDIAYLAAGTGGLRIVNVSDPTDPKEVSSYDYPNKYITTDVFVLGNTAYVTDVSSGLHVIDVTNRAVPEEIGGYYGTDGGAVGIYVVGNTAYVAANAGGLYIIDVSGCGVPVTTTTTTTTTTRPTTTTTTTSTTTTTTSTTTTTVGPVCQCPTDSSLGCISGGVTKKGTGTPLANKWVTAKRISPKPKITKRSKTGADGCYRITDLPDGTWKVKGIGCKKGGEQTIIINSGASANGVNFECK